MTLRFIEFNGNNDVNLVFSNTLIDLGSGDDRLTFAVSTTAFNGSPSAVHFETSGSVLDGGAGSDTLAFAGYGGSVQAKLMNFEDVTGTALGDTFVLGGGNTVSGGAGADTYHVSAASAQPDTIVDFHAFEGDKLSLHDVLAGYNPQTSTIADFVRLQSGGGGTVFEVDADGTAHGANFLPLVTLQNMAFTGGLLDDLIAQGTVAIS